MSTRSNGAGKITKTARLFLLQQLAEFATLSEVQAGLKERFDIEISLPGIVHYRNSEKWKPEIRRLREAMERDLSDIAIASRRWRLRRRQQLIEKAERLVEKPSDVAAPGGLLADAARELDPRRETAGVTQIGSVNIHLVQRAMKLPAATLETWLQTGRLPMPTDAPTEPKQVAAPDETPSS